MRSACAASRAQSATSRRDASTQEMAVPQAPAPRTATFMSVLRDFDARPGLLGRGALLLQVERLEGKRREHHRREAAARDDVGDGLAQIWIEHRGTGDAEQRPEIIGRDIAQLEDAR